jgi:hypothetical protein
MPLVRRLGGTLVAPDFYKHFMDVYKKFEHLHPNVTQPPDMPLCFPDFIKAGLLPFDRVVDRCVDGRDMWMVIETTTTGLTACQATHSQFIHPRVGALEDGGRSQGVRLGWQAW